MDLLVVMVVSGVDPDRVPAEWEWAVAVPEGQLTSISMSQIPSGVSLGVAS